MQHLSWADQINYVMKKAWKALNFTMHVLKMGNSNVKSLAYTSLVRPILEYASPYWGGTDKCSRPGAKQSG
jgi:hypothetical protein